MAGLMKKGAHIEAGFMSRKLSIKYRDVELEFASSAVDISIPN
jgi:hypothetical protein